MTTKTRTDNSAHRDWIRKNGIDQILGPNSNSHKAVKLSETFARQCKRYIQHQMAPDSVQYADLADQLGRASLSTASNAGEAWGRKGPDCRRMLYIAHGSCIESVIQLRVAEAPDELIQLGFETARALEDDIFELSQD